MARTVRRVKPRFWLIMIALVLSGFAVLSSSQQELIEQQNAVIEELTMTKEQMEIAIASAQRKLEFSKSDEYIERIARSELDMIMPGEVLYALPNAE